MRKYELKAPLANWPSESGVELRNNWISAICEKVPLKRLLAGMPSSSRRTERPGTLVFRSGPSIGSQTLPLLYRDADEIAAGLAAQLHGSERVARHDTSLGKDRGHGDIAAAESVQIGSHAGAGGNEQDCRKQQGSTERLELHGMTTDVSGMSGKIRRNRSELDGWIIFSEHLERSHKTGPTRLRESA